MKNAKGFGMLVEAAQAASETFKDHWLRNWVIAHQERLKRCKTNWGRQMAVSGLFADIETVVKDIPEA